MNSTQLTKVLGALSDPSRRQLIARLTLGPATSGQLAEVLTVSRPATSQHLAVLLDAGLVRASALGRNRWNELDPQYFLELEAWIRDIVDVWSDAPVLRTERQVAKVPRP